MWRPFEHNLQGTLAMITAQIQASHPSNNAATAMAAFTSSGSHNLSAIPNSPLRFCLLILVSTRCDHHS